jgi:hypothetical protein
VPTPEEQDALHKIIFDELVKGRVEAASRERFITIMRRIHTAGAQAVILGCTEFGMLLRAGDAPDIPRVDTTELHCQAAVGWMLAKDSGYKDATDLRKIARREGCAAHTYVLINTHRSMCRRRSCAKRKIKARRHDLVQLVGRESSQIEDFISEPEHLRRAPHYWLHGCATNLLGHPDPALCQSDRQGLVAGERGTLEDLHSGILCQRPYQVPSPIMNLSAVQHDRATPQALQSVPDSSLETRHCAIRKTPRHHIRQEHCADVRPNVIPKKFTSTKTRIRSQPNGSLQIKFGSGHLARVVGESSS